MTQKRETAAQKKAREAAEAAKKENGGLLEMLEGTNTEGKTAPEAPQGTDNKEEAANMEKKTARKVLDLGKLAEVENQYKNLSNHEKLKTVGGEKSVEMADKLRTLGIHAIFSKGTASNDMGFYHIGYKIPEIPNNEGGNMEYAEAYNTLTAAWRKNPLFRKQFEAEAQGEIITLAAVGGLFLQFVRPFGDSVILEGPDGNDIEITAANWDKEPIGIWKNGGRATKVGHLLGLTNYLLSDYDRKPSDKFQDNKFCGKYWIVLDKVGEKIQAWKKGNRNEKVTMPEGMGTTEGYKNLIEWAQTVNA